MQFLNEQQESKKLKMCYENDASVDLSQEIASVTIMFYSREKSLTSVVLQHFFIAFKNLMTLPNIPSKDFSHPIYLYLHIGYCSILRLNSFG